MNKETAKLQFLRAFRMLRRSSAILLGLVFLISGIVKIIDPTGSGLIVQEYFKLAGLNPAFTLCKAMGFALAFTESVVGAGLVSGVFKRFFGLVTICMTAFFTLVTLVLLILNPVMDCGCFGEAIHLTHLQTFIKNIFLCLLCAVSFVPFKGFFPARKIKYWTFASVVVIIAALGVWSWIDIPIVDFTDYKPGAELQATSIEKADSLDHSETHLNTYVFEKNGRKAAFRSISSADSSWTYLGEEKFDRTYTASAGTLPVLSLSDRWGEYCDEEATAGDVLLFSIYNTEDFSHWKELREKMLSAQYNGFTPLLVMHGNTQSIEDNIYSCFSEWEAEEILDSALYSDYKTLITLNRSNGGATYICDGIIISKWAEPRIPDEGKMEKLLSENAIETLIKTTAKGRLRLEGIIIYSLFAMLVL